MYWLGLVAAFSGMQMQIVARGWLVYTLTNSPLALGLVSASFGIPLLIFSMIGGAVADLLDKRKILLWAHGFISLVTLVVAVLIQLEVIRLWHLMLAGFLMGLTFVFNGPARMAMVPELVDKPRLLNAISLNSSAMNLTRVLAPSVAGLLVPVLGIQGVYYLVAALYAMAVLAVFQISPTRKTHQQSRPSLSIGRVLMDLKEGIRFILGNSTIKSLMAMAVVPMTFGLSYLILMPVFARDIFHVGPQGLGFLMAAGGAGALMGTISIASLGDFQRKGALLVGLAVGFGLMLVVFGMSRNFYFSLVVLLFLGVCGAGFMAVNNTLIQSHTPQRVLGRVMSLYLVTIALMPLGAVPVSAVAEAIGVGMAVALGGGLNLAFAIGFLLLRPDIRRLR
jgi:MFS family permease